VRLDLVHPVRREEPLVNAFAQVKLISRITALATEQAVGVEYGEVFVRNGFRVFGDGDARRRRQADARTKEVVEDHFPADVDRPVAFVHDQQVVVRARDSGIDDFQRVDDDDMNVPVFHALVVGRRDPARRIGRADEAEPVVARLLREQTAIDNEQNPARLAGFEERLAKRHRRSRLTKTGCHVNEHLAASFAQARQQVIDAIHLVVTFLTRRRIVSAGNRCIDFHLLRLPPLFLLCGTDVHVLQRQEGVDGAELPGLKTCPSHIIEQITVSGAGVEITRAQDAGIKKAQFGKTLLRVVEFVLEHGQRIPLKVLENDVGLDVFVTGKLLLLLRRQGILRLVKQCVANLPPELLQVFDDAKIG